MRLTPVAIVLCLLVEATSATALPRVEAFGRIPTIGNVVLSPDGNLLAWGDASANAQSVVMFDVELGREKRRFTLPANSKLRGLDWQDDETLLVDVSFTHGLGLVVRDRYEWGRTLAVDVAGGDMRMLLMDGTRSLSPAAELVALRTPRPKTVVMATWDFAATQYTEEIGSRLRGGRRDSGWVISLFEVNTASGKVTRIEQGEPYTARWVVDENGQAIARTEWEPERNLFRILRKDGLSWHEIHRQQDGERLIVYGKTRTGDALIAVGANGRDRSCVWEIPLDGSGARVLLEDAANDIDYMALDPFTRQPVGAWIGGVKPEIRWLDTDARARHEALSKTFRGFSVSLGTRSRDHSRVVARVYSASQPATYYLVDFKKGKADIVGEDYPELSGLTLGEVQAISYRSRDGLDITAYLTLPAGRARDGLPMVVLPHGGPEARDDLAFDWLAQFMASRGYAVLQPQFRGSTGFGEAFRRAGYGQWGGLMQDDVTDGVKAMIARGIADPRRICIVGGSYGGYAALAGATFTPDLYACAASINGISDLPAMLGNAEKRGGEESNVLAYWRDHIGSVHDPLVAGRSPVRFANSVRAPVLLIHGIDDTVVPIMQSQLMANALQEAGKSYAFARLEGEDHWLSRSETRVRVLQEIELFLGKFLSAAE